MSRLKFNAIEMTKETNKVQRFMNDNVEAITIGTKDQTFYKKKHCEKSDCFASKELYFVVKEVNTM
jgi:hypothetical protein